MADVKNQQQDTSQRGAQPSTQQPPTGEQGMQRAQPARVQRGGAVPFEPSIGPFALMRRLFDDLEQLTGLGSFMRPFGRSFGRAFDRSFMFPELEQTFERDLVFVPQIDVSRRGDKLVVHVDLPGLAANEINVTCQDNSLIIEGERHREHEGHEGDVFRSERMYGRFQRVIPMPENADLDSAEARFENGVLEISVKAPEQRTEGRKIEIKSSSSQTSSTGTQDKH